MATHNLVIFWRDQQARCFTAWHFKSSSGERPSQRAQKILSVLTQISGLQIYGAALYELLLRSDPDNVVPPLGTDTRLEVSLMPTNKEAVGGGQIRFSIPGPTQSFSQIVAAKQFSSLVWQLLEQEVISYLCSPSGIPVSVSPDHLIKAEITHLDSLHRPQLEEAPIDSAIARTEEALQSARRQFQQNQTQKLLDRVEKHLSRLALLQKWQEMEAILFSEVHKKQTQKIDLLPLIQAKTIAILPPTSHIKEVVMTEQNVSSQSLLLPKSPLQEKAALWEDVPQDHFSLPSMWTHRSQLRSDHGLNERTYYRWIKELGLNRSLPAEGNARVALFYRPDLERALAQSDQTSRHSQTAQAAAVASSQAAEPALVSSQLSSLVNMMADLAAQQKAVTTALSSLETRLTEQRQADLNQIGQQITEMARKQEEISLRLPQGHLLDLIAQLVNLNQLPSAIRQLNSNVKKLAPNAKAKAKATKAKAKATKVKAATKTKRKKGTSKVG